MPDPTKEEFEAAARKVIQTAPPGLSRDAFFDLVTKQLAVDAYHPDPSTNSFTRRAMERRADPAHGMGTHLPHPDEMGNLPLSDQIGDAINHPSPGTQAVADIVTMVAPLLMPRTAPVGSPSRVSVHPGKLLDFKFTEPLKSLKDTIEIKGPKPLVPALAQGGRGSDVLRERALEIPSRETLRPQARALAGQVTGKAPSLNDSLQSALEELLAEGRTGETPAMVSSHPSTVETAGAGPTKQSGKFGKSGSLGQAGGFSSGRPPVSETYMDDLLGKFGGRGETSPDPISGPEGSGTPLAPEPNAAHVLELRTRVGSREAARQLYGSASKSNVQKVLDLTPGYKGGIIPTEAQDRIMDALMKGLMDDPKK